MNDKSDQADPGAERILWRGEYRYVFAGGDGTDDSTSSDDGDGTGTGTPDGTDTGKSGEGDKDDKGEEKTLTQTEVNALIAKEKSKALRGKLDPKEWGFDSRKEMDEFITAAKAKADEDKTDSDKAIEDAKEEAKKTARAEVLAPAQKIALKAEFKLACVDYDIPRDRAEDAFLLAQGMDDWKHVEVDDDGVVTGLDEAFFDDLKEKKPFLFKSEEGDDTGGGKTDIGAGAGGGKRTDSGEDQVRGLFPALQGKR